MYERSGKKCFWSIKSSTKVLNKLKSRKFRAFGLSAYDFSTFKSTLLHNLTKKKIINLIESTFYKEGTLYLACADRIAFFTSGDQKTV